jgi:putative transposase
METVFLPPYSPDLNPIERVWWLMRTQITHNGWVKSLDERLAECNAWCRDTSKQQIIGVCNLIGNI